MYIVQVRWIDYYVKCECVCELFSLNQSNVRVNFPRHSSLIYNAYKMMFAVDRSGDDGDETDKLWCDIWMCHNIFYTVITTINYKASKTFHVLFGWEINSIINIWMRTEKKIEWWEISWWNCLKIERVSQKEITWIKSNLFARHSWINWHFSVLESWVNTTLGILYVQ